MTRAWLQHVHRPAGTSRRVASCRAWKTHDLLPLLIFRLVPSRFAPDRHNSERLFALSLAFAPYRFLYSSAISLAMVVAATSRRRVSEAEQKSRSIFRGTFDDRPRPAGDVEPRIASFISPLSRGPVRRGSPLRTRAAGPSRSRSRSPPVRRRRRRRRL